MSLFAILREQVAIEHVLNTNGGGRAHCVASEHPDTNPSLHLYEEHVHCFSCGFHGDVVDVWAAMRGFDRPVEAALDLAREFGVSLPELSEEGRQSVAERREAEARHQSLAKASHRALERRNGVREWWDSRGFGHELRKRFLLGANEDGTEAVIPFWSRGRVIFLIRCKLQGEPKYILPSSEDLPDGHKPLFIPRSLGREIFLVEGFIDALAVAATGRSGVAVGGTWISDEQSKELRRLLPKEGCLYCLADDDAAGAEAARTWGRQFFPHAKICAASYGRDSKDIADTFASQGSEKTGEHLNV